MKTYTVILKGEGHARHYIVCGSTPEEDISHAAEYWAELGYNAPEEIKVTPMK